MSVVVPRVPDQLDQLSGSPYVWVSAVSGWEVAIKRGLGTLHLRDSFRSMVEASRFGELPVTLRHAEQLAELPAHHTDPFDRRFTAYEIPIIWV